MHYTMMFLYMFNLMFGQLSFCVSEKIQMLLLLCGASEQTGNISRTSTQHAEPPQLMIDEYTPPNDH